MKAKPTDVQQWLSTALTKLAWSRSAGQIFRLATLGAFHFFRQSSYRMTVGKSERTQQLRYHCAASS